MLSNPYTGVLAIFAGRLLNGQSPMVFEDGEQHRDFVHVRDVARLGFQPELPLEDTVLELVDWVSTQQAQDRVRQAHQELETRGLVV